MWDSYIQINYTHCNHDKIENTTYNTFHDAKEACDLNANCGAIYDDNCDGLNLQLCQLGYEPSASNQAASCVYDKPVGKKKNKIFFRLFFFLQHNFSTNLGSTLFQIFFKDFCK